MAPSERAVHLAYWSPLPPARTGVADYALKLLAHLAERFRVSAVVPPSDQYLVEAPPGVSLLSPEDALTGHIGQPDVHLYHVGNHQLFHAWMLGPLRRRPGIVVLHDASLLDMYQGLAAGSPMLWRQVTSRFGYDPALPVTVDVDGSEVADRLTYTCTQDVVDASLVTVVHSRWNADHLSKIHPGSDIRYVPQAADTAPMTPMSAERPPVFTVLGGVERHKRVSVALRAFAKVVIQHPRSRLVVVGRADNPLYISSLRAEIEDLGLNDTVTLRLDVSPMEYREAVRQSDLVVALRWPTAGETSAAIMEALGTGKAVVTSDVPQFSHFDPDFLLRVPPSRPEEVDGVARWLTWAAENRELCWQAGAEGRRWVEANASWKLVTDAFDALIRQQAETSGPTGARTSSRTKVRRLPSPPESDLLAGLHVWGDWSATTGLAHAARRLSLALVHAGADVTATYVDSTSPHDERLYPDELRALERGPLQPLSLWTLNLNELHLVPDEELLSERTQRYNIGTWYWEFPTIPEWMQVQFDRISEIWAPTNFVKRAMYRYTDKPVVVVPPVVPVFDTDEDPFALRSRLGIPTHRTVFLVTFDFNSTIGRKNPLGAIQAFASAFPKPGPRRPVLVVKTINLEKDPAFARLLADAVAAVDGVLIDRHLNEQDMASLYCACDVYVSLHRSEGFGLGLAESMAIGKAVIGTAYSGNLDFMSPDNSCLVGYRLRPVQAGDQVHDPTTMTGIYVEGALWADPDLDQAAEWMQILEADHELRRDIGRAARATMQRSFSEQAVARTAISRIATLNRQLGIAGTSIVA